MMSLRVNELTNFSIFFSIILLSYNIHEIGRLIGLLQHQLDFDAYENSNRSTYVTRKYPENNGKKIVSTSSSTSPVAWIHGEGRKRFSCNCSRKMQYFFFFSPLSTYLHNVVKMFHMMGYKVTSDEPVEWNVLWTHEYSLMSSRYVDVLRNAKPNTFVNHIAGSGYYTSKVSLVTSNASRSIPLAFSLPKHKDRLLKYAEQNPNDKWIQKDNSHRNIRVLKLNEMDLNKENSFVQHFIDNPLLIDNRKFDIGIYTVVTSILPLRVYVYEEDVLLRFCSDDYLPFDSNKTDKYVVGDNYTPIWEIPSLKPFFVNQKLGWRDTLNAYLQSKKIEPEAIWTQINKIICELHQPTLNIVLYPME
ncbi:hypothetical protein DICVIV_05453 [Dictyocaulus viviparus]|uniref:Tubulin-tyrosine ligase family protein n=1 Tax=Dictyocaulus viviparus TaxID=29172 RepID=A0A0D8XXH4_DICVI|nr:hypothetical protein DICVIV_05453 [Dictyocaulus viviparus]